MMRIAPKTPKAGVILVSNMIGVVVGEAEDVGTEEFVEVEAWRVLVALNTVGRTVIMVVAMFPD
jgi:hypothetical protein